ncbi:MAG: hypothetical protein WAV20_17480 [Blastocatellia bacterium]
MRFTLDSDLKRRVHDGRSEPLLFEPEVDWAKFKEPNIIHAY